MVSICMVVSFIIVLGKLSHGIGIDPPDRILCREVKSIWSLKISEQIVWYLLIKFVMHFLILLAGEYQNVRQWYDLKDNLWLYGNIAKDLGNTPIILYSISKVGDTGIIPIDKLIDLMLLIIEDNPILDLRRKEQSTILYMERVFRRYIGDNKMSIKRNVELKKKLILILTFMLERGSVHGYLLRESIL